MPEFVGYGLQIPVYQIAPCIDPLAEKNQTRTLEEAHEILAPLFDESDIDPGRPILAAISRYDVHKNQGTILEAFQKLRKKKKPKSKPYLIFLGNTASDDPESDKMLAKLQELAGDDADVRFWANVENNDQVVGALARAARAFIHVSTEEGFGLVVSEALWQGTPVIGSKVGGITKQVIDGKTGYLVDPTDVDATADRMARLLEDPAEAEALGEGGREHVRANFLLPELVRRYLVLLRYYCGVDREFPAFRLSPVTSSEFLNLYRAKIPSLSGITDPRILKRHED
jgi:trehalose synthase